MTTFALSRIRNRSTLRRDRSLQLRYEALKALPVCDRSAVRKPYSQTVCIVALYYAPETRVDVGRLEDNLHAGTLRELARRLQVTSTQTDVRQLR